MPDIPADVSLALLVSAGQSAVRLGDFDKGLGYYESALSVDPNEVSALKNLGALYLAKEDFESALIHLDSAIEQSEDDKEKADFMRRWKELNDAFEMKLYYGHLFCHVLHQNYILKKGFDAKSIKKELLDIYPCL